MTLYVGDNFAAATVGHETMSSLSAIPILLTLSHVFYIAGMLGVLHSIRYVIREKLSTPVDTHLI